MSITYCITQGITTRSREVRASEIDIVDVRADYLGMKRMHVCAEVLRRFKNLTHLRFEHCTFDDDAAWPETITNVELLWCNLDSVPHLPGASVTRLYLYHCTSAAWELVMDRVARSNVNVMRFLGAYGFQQVVEMLPRSKIADFELRDVSNVDVATIHAFVRVAETCDIERIAFQCTRVRGLDLRRTRKLVEFGHIVYSKWPHKPIYLSELDVALNVRRVLGLLGARTGPALRFLKRDDDDHACMARVFRLL